ncbi:MAG TPA: ABC transporter substrate-binding protein [Bacillota bacterium]|jgi:hypothetical protein|nr:hypothetical protein [Fastidiosipila sp.]HPX92961.1 ABC transporter substrate-binding protein [Bacillota bacterium]HQB80775.1 ABC transporter substrate-binding protein [Bacillota bacterium]
MKKFAAVLLGIIVFAVASGCRAGGQDILPEGGPEESLIPATLPPPSAAAPDDRIRVAMRPEVNLNPIFPKHYATSSLLELIYQPLFDVTSDGRIQPVLARSWRWSADGLECSIRLEENRHFHNGQAVTAQDARASMEQFLKLMNGRSVVDDPVESLDPFPMPDLFSGIEKWRYQSYQNIISVAVNEAGELVIGLREPDPLLPRLLLFPIVPESQAQSQSMTPPAGTGDWQVESHSASHLVLTGGSGRIRRIEASVYPTAVEAAYAFELGEIDLLLMDSAETALFADRSRIRKQLFDDAGYLSLFFSGSKGNSRDNRDALLYVFGSDPELSTLSVPFPYAGYPVSRGDFRLRGAAVPPLEVPKIPENFGLPEGAVEFDEKGEPVSPDLPPFKLLVPVRTIQAGLIRRLSIAFLRINRKLIVEEVHAEDWPATLSQRKFDAVMLADTVPFFPDPADYLDGLRALGLLDGMEAMESGSEELLRQARLASLDLSGEEGNSLSPDSYAEAVNRVFKALPVTGLAATATMVWYSRNIEGSLPGTSRAPYLGVEDLFVWR